ncbi:MAG: hypothetical protein Q7J45_02980 [bacterium]|nr:hypothetical protein [bacterium]
MIGDFLSSFQYELLPRAWDIFLATWPVWVPLIALNLAWSNWVSYVQRDWLNKQGYVLLEIKLPHEVKKSPAAMEFVLNGIWENANISTPADAFWEGKQREWFSLEIVSLGGQIKFFIWAFPRWKKIIEARIYAQYPEAEVHEVVRDYALDLTAYDTDKYTYWGITTALTKPDAYPIKTYVDYELDKVNLKEQEEAIDPLTPMLEYLGTLKPGEFAAVQILLRAHAKENFLYGRFVLKKDWKDDVKKEIKKIIEEEAFIKPEKDKPASMIALTDDQKQTIKSIERNAGKLAFDSMIRMIYVAENEVYDKSRGIGLIGSTRQFGTHNLNGIKPDKFMSITHTWQDFNGWKKKELQSTHLDAFKRRSFFGGRYKNLNAKSYVLSTEEVATLFHLPGAMAKTPTLARTPSKKAQAPANLPV